MNAHPEAEAETGAPPAYRKVWDAGANGLVRDPYLDSKGITAPQVLARLKLVHWKGRDYLAVPYHSVTNGALLAVQRIERAPDANAKFAKVLLPGSTWKGAAFNIGGDEPAPEFDGLVLVGEGLATMSACWRAEPQCVALAAGPVSNLRNAARAARHRWPHARIVIVSDAGVEDAAREAAAACDGWLATMPEGSPRGFDAWDCLRANGDDPDELKRIVLDRAVKIDPLREERHEDHREAGTHARGAVKPLAGIAPERIDWLWPGWIPFAKLTLFAGMGGSAKTTTGLDLAAIVTTGGTWPDGSKCERARDVVIWTGEDGVSDTLVPRLMAAGADMNRVFLAIGRTPDGAEVPFDPAVHLASLDCSGRDVGAMLIDPIMNVVRGDANKPTEVRRALQPVIDLAQSTGAAVIGITHFSKSSKEGSRRAVERVIGSQAWTAVSRMTYVLAHNEKTGARVIARAKSNIAPEHGGYAFRTVETTVGDGIPALRIEWGSYLDLSADEIIDSVDSMLEEENSARTEAEQFLHDLLIDGPRLYGDVFRESRGAGVPWHAIEKAAKKLDVQKRKTGGTGSPWAWALPG
ncbi:AAA family ATPase [Paraburkholderia sp. J7]|uniref:AAA family ATPase n=1 Tax=Paraburkholderia sp. J7 TaxID=2805438 RepID=UPI002AB7AD76|nr:AAA family ATPase [Paraburkholderia sp. J7]